MSEATAAPVAAPAAEASTAPIADTAPVVAVEGAPATEPEKKTVPPFNPRTREFAALTRKEREVRAQLATLKEAEGKHAKWEAAQKLAKENPDEYLRQAGLTYDDVTKFYVSGNAPAPDAKMRALEERIAKYETTLAERDAAALQKEEQGKVKAVIDGFVAKISSVVQSNPEYELIRSEGAVDQVYELIDLHYNKYHEILDIDVAAKQIEATLEAQSEATVKKLLAVEKLQRKLGYTPTADPKGSPKHPGTGPAKGTLTDELIGATRPGKPETPDERWRRIVASVRTD